VLPEGYTGLVLANGRRSRDWQLGLEAAGFEVVRVPATGKDSEKGSWQIGVVKADEARARAFVGEVIRGRVELPSAPSLSPMGVRALMGVGLIIALLVLLLLAAR
jgi:hypothetical protein